MATMSKLIQKLLQLEWADPDKRQVLFQTSDDKPVVFKITKISEQKSKGGDTANKVILWGEDVNTHQKKIGRNDD